jgi:hypothetical protein
MALKETIIGIDVWMIWFLSEHMAYRNYKSFYGKWTAHMEMETTACYYFELIGNQNDRWLAKACVYWTPIHVHVQAF